MDMNDPFADFRQEREAKEAEMRRWKQEVADHSIRQTQAQSRYQEMIKSILEQLRSAVYSSEYYVSNWSILKRNHAGYADDTQIVTVRAEFDKIDSVMGFSCERLLEDRRTGEDSYRRTYTESLTDEGLIKALRELF